MNNDLGKLLTLESLLTHARHVQDLLNDNEAETIRSLLDSDEDLLQYLRTQVSAGCDSLQGILHTVDLLCVLQTNLFALQQQTKSSLLMEALAGQLKDSDFESSLFSHLKRSNSEALHDILTEVLSLTGGHLHKTCKTLLKELDRLRSQQKANGVPLRSEDDLHNATLRTTVVAKKVELSKQKSTLTKGDAAYSDILRRFIEALEAHLSTTLIDPKYLVFNEIFMYDLKSPHKDVFTPKPRGAIERALASPHDYLDCSCCAPDAGADDESTLASSQPSTAILYQLYLESGALINVADLRTAFVTILGDDKEEAQTK